MKRSVLRSVILLIAMMVLSIAPSTCAAYAASLSDAPVMVMSATLSGDEVTVYAILRQNTGIMGMTLEIEYDATAMTLTKVERGEALSSLEYMTTNINTAEGYAKKPFVLNWSGEKNDSSAGTIVRMTFRMKESVADGEYDITLKPDEGIVAYWDKDVKSKNILIDGAKIKVVNNVAEVVLKETDEGEEVDLALVISLSVVGGVLFAGSVVAVILVLKKYNIIGKKSWKKVE